MPHSLSIPMCVADSDQWIKFVFNIDKTDGRALDFVIKNTWAWHETLGDAFPLHDTVHSKETSLISLTNLKIAAIHPVDGCPYPEYLGLQRLELNNILPRNL